MKEQMKPDYLFETSWEVCNKVGGIYTVLSTKAKTLKEQLGDNLIMIGPEVWKETSNNPYFEEDKNLYADWVSKALEDGLNIRIGRWKIAGEPVVILVDFTQYFTQKNDIFSEYWEHYRLDSLQGGWDYIEPAMFGYAAAKVIEHFYEYNIAAHDRLLSHFHEWMTGLGLLYLNKNVPQSATVFTTHATSLGRSVAGNGMPLYSEMESYNPFHVAERLGIKSKFSLERNAAVHADALTTVSDITARECKVFFGREVDEVTPNGFDDAFAPGQEKIEQMRGQARESLYKFSEAVTGYKPSDNAFFVATSGRYEYTNKGIDVFLDALQTLKTQKPEKEIWGFVLVPGGHKGPEKEVMKRFSGGSPETDTAYVSSHKLAHPNQDAVMNKLKAIGFHNQKGEKVHVIFVPAYLNGDDGIINKTYYELLAGFDLTVFPSYYEPWGYTPLESLAYYVPTVTTSLTGMGQWVKERYPEKSPGIAVVHRDENNYDEVVGQVAQQIDETTRLTKKKLNELRANARELSRIALWESLIPNYFKVYGISLGKALERYSQYESKQIPRITSSLDPKSVIPPQWNKILIEPKIPDELQKLTELTRNIWWTWDHDAKELFSSIADGLWKKFDYNPIHLLEELTFEQLQELANDKTFLEKLDNVYARFSGYIKEKENQDSRSIAYFSMEYGLHDTIKTYSGGLGMLAGDYLKEASDSNVNMVAVGLLYRHGYFIQHINRFGEQHAEYVPQKFTHLPLNPVRDEHDNWVKISLAFPGRNVTAKVWRLDVGRVPLYLLYADIEENNAPADRFITHQLYGGDNENRLKQEFLLGIGGIRMLEKLGIHTTIYHINEGHAAFIGLERLYHLMSKHRLRFYQAVEVVRGTSLYTTHTPVPAGHDAFDEDLMRRYMPHYAERLNISWESFMGMGRVNPNDTNEKFSMSALGLYLSQEVNGVSKLHGEVSRDMFEKYYPGYLSEELHIGHVTNGVHYANWTSNSWRELHDSTFGKGWRKKMTDPAVWEKIYDVADEKVWEIRNYQRKKLINYLKKRVGGDMMRRQETPRMMRKVNNGLGEDKLTFGFARRFATYKRAHLLFNNLERLSAIINNEAQPVQFVFAGKAHPNDKMGQDLLKYIFEISRRDEFAGKILFVEDYDIRLGRKMVQGVDVWLNTPARPLEASGTSGQKAALNGVLNCSVLDGWWAEGYVEDAGWALPQEKAFGNQDAQDELDAETLYDILEEEIVPAFYERNEKGIPEKWVAMMKKNFAEIAPHFTTRRMLEDYSNKFYNELFNMAEQVRDEKFKSVRSLVSWKRKIWAAWDQIIVKRKEIPNSYDRPLKLGDRFQAKVTLNTPGLSEEDLGLELVFGKKENDQIEHFLHVEQMEVKESKNDEMTFACDIVMTKAGVHDYAFRLYPKNKLLKHRQTSGLVKWL
jgi:phosphorylase/glycogen(starch) synthase